MHIFQKLLVSVILSTFVSLHLLPLVDCSDHLHDDQKHNANNKMSADKIFNIHLHGILLWGSMGLFMPIGVLAIRMSNRQTCSRKTLQATFYFHAISQILAVLLSTSGAILSLRSFENSFNNCHQRVGAALYVAVWVQALIGLRRPQRGTKGRKAWYLFHWIYGTILSLVGIFNIFTGLKAYHKRTSRSIGLWSILFIAELSFIALCYLFQEKWEHIQKQGVILGNQQPQVTASDQVLPLGENQKDITLTAMMTSVPQDQPRRNSNSLGNYFAKSNALRKLFQLTS